MVSGVHKYFVILRRTVQRKSMLRRTVRRTNVRRKIVRSNLIENYAGQRRKKRRTVRRTGKVVLKIAIDNP